MKKNFKNKAKLQKETVSTVKGTSCSRVWHTQLNLINTTHEYSSIYGCCVCQYI